MQRAASIMKIPVSDLLQQAARPAGRLGPAPLVPTALDGAQRVVDLHADEDDDGQSLGCNHDLGREADVVGTDTPDDGQQNDNDSRDSASEPDIAPWQSSGAEFRNIDDDISRDYERVPRWGEDFPVLSQAPPPVQAPGSKTGPAPSAVHGQDPLWDFPTLEVSYVPEASQTHQQSHQSPSTVSTLTALGTSVPTPGYSSSGGFVTPQQQQHQSWELVEMPQPPQQSQQVPAPAPRAYDWAINVPFGVSAQPSANSGLADVSSDALRFIPVDPIQPQAISRPQKRGPFQDRERQEETSRTRGLKACVRCRMQKIRVS